LVNITYIDDLRIRVDSGDRAYLKDVKEYFTDYVEGFRYLPKYKAGVWDGKISMFDVQTRSLPYGLTLDLLKFHKTKYPDIEIKMDKKIIDKFTGIDVELDYDLNIFPRPYQLECIETALKHRSSIIVAATASGKSGIIAYIVRTLMNNDLIKKTIIIVPTISLVIQMYKDFVEYGIDESLLGKVYTKAKEFDRSIVISTWQSLKSTYDRTNNGVLEDFDCVIVDEVHSSKSLVLRTLLSKCINATWRFGFTGTMPENKIDTWNVKSYLGPIVKTIKASELADLGYITQCKIESISIDYSNPNYYSGDYQIIKEKAFNNKARMTLLKNIVNKVDSNILVLVGKVEKEGVVLKEFFENSKVNKEVVFIHGDTKPEDREFWRNELGKRNNIIIIATYQIFSVGINIPSLKYILFASPFKSKIRTLQSIGRTLRKHEAKDFSVIYDIIDNVKFLEDHGVKRHRYYNSENFEVNETNYKEEGLYFT